MAIPDADNTGHVDFRGWRTWYRLTGEPGSRPPVVALHGGPGTTHSYAIGRRAGLRTLVTATTSAPTPTRTRPSTTP